jgi:hypothetical protein
VSSGDNAIIDIPMYGTDPVVRRSMPLQLTQEALRAAGGGDA